MYIKVRYISVYVLVLLVLSGCKIPRVAESEKVSLPQDTIIPYDTAFVKPMLWTEFLQDTILQGYIRSALQNNHSFEQSMEHIVMSRASLQRAKGRLLPEVGFQLGASFKRFGEYTMDGMENIEDHFPSQAKDKRIPDPYRDLGVYLNFQWEADIWGKLTRKKQASAARWMASIEATRFSQSLLISDLAIQYYELIGLDKRKEVLQTALDGARYSYELTCQLKKEGIETQLAVDQFRAHVLSIENLLLENECAIGVKERSIACLLGVFPFKVRHISFEELQKLPVPLSEGIPANLLSLRPDVKAAEMKLIASKADVMVAKAAFYPSLTIGGSGGFNAFDIGKWFQTPASLVYDLAAGITAPIFRRNEIRAMWHEAKSSQRIALSQYHETALKAYMEVIDLYCTNQIEMKRVRLKELETSAHVRSVANANKLFKLNYTGFLEVLSAEERYLYNELERIELLVNLRRQNILLYRALGGGC